MTSFGWDNRKELDEYLTKRLLDRSLGERKYLPEETMKHETHFVTSDYRPPNGQTHTADCGAEVHNSLVVPVWDDLAVGSKLTMPTSTSLYCDKCWRRMLETKTLGPVKIWAITEKRKSKWQSEGDE